jgi:hypothetical protein
MELSSSNRRLRSDRMGQFTTTSIKEMTVSGSWDIGSSILGRNAPTDSEPHKKRLQRVRYALEMALLYGCSRDAATSSRRS